MELNINEIMQDLQTAGAKPSVSYIQRRWQIGFNAAYKVLDILEKQRFVTEPNHLGKRQLIQPNSEA
jgi:S-DNA-T family DNA segregation ATPase FtsK/SpoIIIE